MPSTNANRDGKRDKYVRQATSSLFNSGKVSGQNAYKMAENYMKQPGPIKKTKRKPRRAPRGRRKTLSNMSKAIWKNGQPLVKGAYDMATPHIRRTMNTLKNKGAKQIENMRVPRVDNNSSWADLRTSLNSSLIDKGIIDDAIDISEYFRAVETFLKKYKDISFSKDDIKKASYALQGRDPGSALDGLLISLGEGISLKSIQAILEYLFLDNISTDTDMDIEVDSETDGWTGVVKTKRLERLKDKGSALERQADISSKLLNGSTLNRDINQYTRELNSILEKMAVYLSDVAEDEKLIVRLRDKYSALVNEHQKTGHKIKSPFGALMGVDYGAKKKKKKKKTKKRSRKSGFFF